MARTDTLGHFLTDVADAIRTKTGSSDAIQASSFDTAIANIPSGGKYAPKYVSFRNFSGYDLDDEVAGLDTSNITNMINMFYSDTGLVSLDLSNWDTSNVTSMGYMFYYNQSLQTIDLTGFDTTKVTDVSYMFYYTYSLQSITGLSNLTFPQVANFNYMFNYSGLPSININADTQLSSAYNVNLYGLAFQCSNLTSLSLSNFKQIQEIRFLAANCPNLSSVTFTNCEVNQQTSGSDINFNSMFASCSSLTTLDLSWIDCKRRQSWSSAFNGCTSLTHIDLRNNHFTTTSSNYSNMFGSSASSGVPDNCEIIVKDDTEKSWITSRFSRLTNVKTVAEYEG